MQLVLVNQKQLQCNQKKLVVLEILLLLLEIHLGLLQVIELAAQHQTELVVVDQERHIMVVEMEALETAGVVVEVAAVVVPVGTVNQDLMRV
jgi:hypothetical protein